MTVTELLEKDHEEMMEMIERLESTDIEQLETADRNSTPIYSIMDLVRKLHNAMTHHRLKEEQIFYPALANFSDTQGLIQQFYQEHQRVDQLLSELHNQAPINLAWKAKLGELRDSVKQHVEREVNELFVKAEELLGRDRLLQMALQMDE